MIDMSEPNCNTQPEEEESPQSKQYDMDLSIHYIEQEEPIRAGSNKAKQHIIEHTAVRVIKEGQDEQLIR